MKSILYLLACVSGLGLVLSFASHVAALLGLEGPLGAFTPVLHFGIFVVWLPAILAMNRLTKNVARKDLWKAALRGAPAWMRNMTYGFFGYALFNFALFMFLAPKGGGAGPMPPQIVRGFSGHWMAFYSAALAVLYSASELWDQAGELRCPGGHTVQPLSKFCDQCGLTIVHHRNDGSTG